MTGCRYAEAGLRCGRPCPGSLPYCPEHLRDCPGAALRRIVALTPPPGHPETVAYRAAVSVGNLEISMRREGR